MMENKKKSWKVSFRASTLTGITFTLAGIDCKSDWNNIYSCVWFRLLLSILSIAAMLKEERNNRPNYSKVWCINENKTKNVSFFL